MIRRPPRSTQSRSSAASDVYKRQVPHRFTSLLRLTTSVSAESQGRSQGKMNAPEPQKTYLDYRNSLRKVDLQQRRSISGQSSQSTSPTLSFAFRHAPSASTSANPSAPAAPAAPGVSLKPSPSVHSHSSSISPTQQPRSDQPDSSPVQRRSPPQPQPHPQPQPQSRVHRLSLIHISEPTRPY